MSIEDQKTKQLQKKTFAEKTGMTGQTLLDWIRLLLIPLVLAGFGYWFTSQQNSTNLQISERQHQVDLQIANNQTQEAALQNYLDHMTDLLLNYHLLHSKPGDEVREVARARTLTILPGLDSQRKSRLLGFLLESGLIFADQAIVDLRIADLSNASLHLFFLSGTELRFIDLSGADLSESNLAGADLWRDNLGKANLNGADLRGAILSEAFLAGANLRGANLKGANLSGADLRGANPNEAWVPTTNLKGAWIDGADLQGADLSGVDLRRAKVSNEQLSTVKTLHGAIMPNGSIHP